MIPAHGPQCPCPGCRLMETRAREEERKSRELIPERPVWWRWLHGPDES